MAYPSRVEEERYIRQLLENDEVYVKRLKDLYKEAHQDVQDRIDLFLARNATQDKLSKEVADLPATATERQQLIREVSTTPTTQLTDAHKRSIIHGIDEPGLTRLKLLGNHIQLNVAKLETQHTPIIEEFLNNSFVEEYLRQHENIGFTPTAEQYDNLARTIIHQSFEGNMWTTRLGNHSVKLQRDLLGHVETALLSGKNPSQGIGDLAKEIEKTYIGEGNISAMKRAEMLAITESGRIQTETQKYSYDKYGIEEYEFIGELDACKECEALIGETFYVNDMEPGYNACPMHPRCRCSAIPKIDRSDWNYRMISRTFS